MDNPYTANVSASLATLEKLLSGVSAYRTAASQRFSQRGIVPTPLLAREETPTFTPMVLPAPAPTPVAPSSVAPSAPVVPRPAAVAPPPSLPPVVPQAAPQSLTPTPPVLPQALTATPDVRAAEISARTEDPSKVTTKLPLFLSPAQAPRPDAQMPPLPPSAPASGLVPEMADPRPAVVRPGAAPSTASAAVSAPASTSTSVVRPLPMPAPLSNREPSSSFRAVPQMLKDVAGQVAPGPSEARRPGSAPSTQVVPSQTLGEFLKRFNLTA